LLLWSNLPTAHAVQMLAPLRLPVFVTAPALHAAQFETEELAE
jgi:hypothetical protein